MFFFAYLLGFSVPRMLGKILFFLGLVFEIHFRGRTFVFVVLLRSSVFQCCFAYVFAYLLVFHSRECLAKILFFLGLVFKSFFGGELLFLLSCRALLFFSVVLPVFLHICWVSLFPKTLMRDSAGSVRVPSPFRGPHSPLRSLLLSRRLSCRQSCHLSVCWVGSTAGAYQRPLER